ncbi:hypothetical protein O7626_40595 [Micromonospora sp. WMMD1102]|uniref:hypothetical protein n=1 Tax=Micromonospora sp. WMMD1102 TaxID=3016105 RepID=UPI0024152406|nr:hypothetical protein [Micromonospora sp. WMMD1102]MDG4792117.1 hypothetical protein [Micromonospora sp. WMMD1102]
MSTHIPTPEEYPARWVDAAAVALGGGTATSVDYERAGRVLAALDEVGALALDLPARDARIRADERRKIDKEIRRYAAQLRDTGAGTSAIVAEDVAGRVAAADDSPAAGSAVPAEGSAHSPAVGRLPWPHGTDPVTDAWLRSQGADPDEIRTRAREHIDTLIRRTGGDDRG